MFGKMPAYLRRYGVTQTEREAFAVLDSAEFAGRVNPDGPIGRRIVAREKKIERARLALIVSAFDDVMSQDRPYAPGELRSLQEARAIAASEAASDSLR